MFRLQTADGDTREYLTVYTAKGEPDPVGDSEGSPHYLDKYCTYCGREWNKKPTDHEECDHLECAIYLGRKVKKDGHKGFMFGIFLAAVSLILGGILMAEKGQNRVIILLLIPGALFPLLLAFRSLIRGHRAGEELLELTEFRDRGTVNGIKAWQIFENPHAR
jgi:hypothetical protein